MLKNLPCCEEGCGLCQKQQEIRQINGKRKRDLSLQSIYRKDYHSKIDHLTFQIDLPKLTKNQSMNIQGKPKDYFHINSTYLSNYQNNNPQKLVRVFSKQLTPSPLESLKNYKSTYQCNYQELPLLDQEVYLFLLSPTKQRTTNFIMPTLALKMKQNTSRITKNSVVWILDRREMKKKQIQQNSQ